MVDKEYVDELVEEAQKQDGFDDIDTVIKNIVKRYNSGSDMINIIKQLGVFMFHLVKYCNSNNIYIGKEYNFDDLTNNLEEVFNGEISDEVLNDNTYMLYYGLAKCILQLDDYLSDDASVYYPNNSLIFKNGDTALAYAIMLW